MATSETDYFLSVFSVFTTAITLTLFFSPWPAFKEIQAKKSVGNLSCTPFILSFMNCILWVGYGTYTQNMVVLFVNTVGTITSTYYIFTFYSNTQPAQKEKLNYHLGGALAFLFCAFLYISMSGEDAIFRLGILASVVSICMFAAPLEKMFLVITTKSTESMVWYIFPFAVMSFLCGLSWTIYGAMVGDQFVLMPNLLATILSSVQLSLFAFYSNGTSRPDRKEVV